MFGLAPLRLYLYAGVLLAFIGVLGFAGCEHKRAQRATARGDSFKQSYDQAVAANISQTDVIASQNRALNEWAKLGITRPELEAILDQIRRHKERASALEAENNLLRSKDRALPECVALLKMSITERCPSIAISMRNAADHYKNGAGRNTGPGSPAHPF